MSLETLLGDSIVRLKLNSHVVVLGRDDFRNLGATVFTMQLRVGGEATPHLHVVVFTDLNAQIRLP